MPLLVEASKEDIWNSSNLHSSRWKLSEDVSGPAIAFFVSVEFVLSLPSNVFIVLHSIYYYKKSFSNPSTFFLFNFALSDLIETVFYMPFIIVSASVGEWIFGSTDQMRDILCQIHGFVLMYSSAVCVNLLAVLSIDRFLYIAKANEYNKIMTMKVAVIIVIAIWVCGIILNLTPYYGQHFGAYNWSGIVGGCGPANTKDDFYFLIVVNAQLAIVVIIIAITTVWTLLYSYGFLKKTLKRHKTHLNLENFDIQKSLYTKRIKNLFGIFGILLLTNGVFWLPVIISNLLSVIVTLPPALEPVNMILYLFSSVTNPILQIYFRKELCDSLKEILESLRYWISYVICFKKRKHLTISRQISQTQRRVPFYRNYSTSSSGSRIYSIARQNSSSQKSFQVSASEPKLAI